MKEASPRTIKLADYSVPAFLIHSVDLHFDLRDGETRVTAQLEMQRNPDSEHQDAVLSLEGVKLNLLELAVDGTSLPESSYERDEEGLTIFDVPEKFTLHTVVSIHPESNTALEGLYQSSGNYCTQCEAHGFRKITYYLDRPDVMAVFTTTIEADQQRFPVLLSNGNPIEQGEAEGGRHWAKWLDPYKKPSYLFALVAGDLALTKGNYTTRSGRDVALQIYTEKHNADKTAHALRSLQRAMQWDEETFGLEYDLDIYMIVAVDDFNMGAMENKGLNVFNSKFVLARPDTATDTDYVNIEAVIAHEYFHNWTGNRVTCRDWFQLSLKEGLTVFRDQSFTADMTSAAVKRIDDVRALRTHQFAEDASPMAHPVRPASYIEINNFYTLTVYEKGAEVVRLYQTLLGKKGFRKGMDLYFQRHDGQAVTTDDFRRAMADANGVDLSQLQRWYEQAGTPEIRVTEHWEETSGQYTLKFTQSCPPTPDSDTKRPYLIPLKLKLLDPDQPEKSPAEQLLRLTESEHHFHFEGLSNKPVPSMLREFSAPVKLSFDYSDEQLAFLMAHDDDSFNRWDAGQTLAERVLLGMVGELQANRKLQRHAFLNDAIAKMLSQPPADAGLLAEALTLPAEAYLAQKMAEIDPDAIHQARELLIRELAQEYADHWQALYQQNQSDDEYRLDALSLGRRRLKNLALQFVVANASETGLELAMQQFEQASNMTDSMGALIALARHDSPQRQQALAQFHDRWQHDSLVMDKWFTLQATMSDQDILQRVKALTEHPLFSMKNPNKVRAVISAFAQANPVGFHRVDGSGYRFVADSIITLDPLNPQVASRLSKAFTNWRRYDADRQQLMRSELERILTHKGLSKDVFEVVERSLA